MKIFEEIPDLTLTIPPREDTGDTDDRKYLTPLSTDEELEKLLRAADGKWAGLTPTCMACFWVLAIEKQAYLLDTRKLRRLNELLDKYEIVLIVDDAFRRREELAKIGITRDVNSLQIQQSILHLKHPLPRKAVDFAPRCREYCKQLTELGSLQWYKDLRATQVFGDSPGFNIDLPRYKAWLQEQRNVQAEQGGTNDPAATWESYLNTFGLHFPVHLTPSGQETGRFTSTAPSLHNVPNSLKKAFLAQPGYVLFSADYHQAQPRILCALSDGAVFGQPFREGADLYKYLMAGVRNKAVDEVSPEERKVGKGVLLGLINGMGAEKLATQLSKLGGDEVTTDTAREILSSLKNRFPDMMKWLNTIGSNRKYCIRLGEDLRYIGLKTPSGRILKYDGNTLKAYVLRSHLAQAVEVEIMVKAIILLREQLAEHLPQGRLLHFIHDEILISVPESESQKAEPILRQCLEQAFGDYFAGNSLKDVLMNNLVEVSGPARCWGDLK